jgi:hypothetical protein
LRKSCFQIISQFSQKDASAGSTSQTTFQDDFLTDTGHRENQNIQRATQWTQQFWLRDATDLHGYMLDWVGAIAPSRLRNKA